MIALVDQVISATLEGVGTPEERHREMGEWALHVRRPMTSEEEAGLPRKPCRKSEEA